MTSVKYVSTRGADKGTTFKDAVLKGLASDGGLLVPEEIPTIKSNPFILEEWSKLSFANLAVEVMGCFIKEDEISKADLKKVVNKSYNNGKWRSEEVTPVVKLKDGRYILELFHGPTFAFKDVALQFLGNLFEHILSEKEGDEARLTILGATSGDTGSSAIHGVRGKAGIECFIMFPHNAVSDVQRLQMTTVIDPNIRCLAIKGTFDDAQSIVKKLNMDKTFKEKHRLGAVNSINWARILAQIVYYFYAYFRVREADKNNKRSSEKVSFSVPTGNFGDILAGFYAKQMGLPINELICATNENDILEVFFRTGHYTRQKSVKTNAPSMDICVSSNFERFLYHVGNNNPKLTLDLMKTFDQTKQMKVNVDFLKKAKDEISAVMVDESERFTAIKDIFESDQYLIDPHTSIGVSASQYAMTNTPIVCLACAHWAKFPDAIRTALDSLPEKQVKDAMVTPDVFIKNKKLRERQTIIENDSDDVKKFINSSLIGSNVYETEISSSTGDTYRLIALGAVVAVVGIVAYNLLKK